jgi:chemotaxis protein CheX
MNVKFLNPFVESAFEVLQAEAGVQSTRGDLGLEKEPYITEDVTVIISLVGRVDGNVFYSMTQQTAIQLVSRVMGEPLEKFDVLAQSGIAELGNVITGRASVKLAAAGYEATISPPTLLLGKGATISTLDFPRLIVPMIGEWGQITIHLALREGTNQSFSAGSNPVAPQKKF